MTERARPAAIQAASATEQKSERVNAHNAQRTTRLYLLW